MTEVIYTYIDFDLEMLKKRGRAQGPTGAPRAEGASRGGLPAASPPPVQMPPRDEPMIHSFDILRHFSLQMKRRRHAARQNVQRDNNKT